MIAPSSRPRSYRPTMAARSSLARMSNSSSLNPTGDGEGEWGQMSTYWWCVCSGAVCDELISYCFLLTRRLSFYQIMLRYSDISYVWLISLCYIIIHNKILKVQHFIRLEHRLRIKLESQKIPAVEKPWKCHKEASNWSKMIYDFPQPLPYQVLLLYLRLSLTTFLLF